MVSKKQVEKMSRKLYNNRDKKGAVFYDIGSGTGSIAVEAAGLSNDIRVFAIEKKEEAKQLAIEFYGPIFLMYSLYDNKREGDDLAEMLKKHVDRFSKKMDSY